MKKYLIVNADDFGLNREVNEGIIYGFRNGIITSASLLINREGLGDALEKIKENPRLDIGLHLNIFRGRPLTELKYLVKKDGEMVSDILLFLLKIAMNKKTVRAEIYQEFEAQIKKALENGVIISHLDTEKHIHMFPFVFKIVIELAKKFNIGAVRFPFESHWALAIPYPRQLPKLFFGNFFYRINKRIIKASGVKTSDYFYGVSLSGRYSEENFHRFLNILRPGVSELSCHPGLVGGKISYYIDKFRQKELDVFTSESVKKHLAELGIEAVNFKFISDYYEWEK